MPAGTLNADTEITITELGEDEIDAAFDGFDVEKAFGVEPDGLEFITDVEIELTLDIDATKSEDTPIAVSPVVMLDLAPADHALRIPDLAISADAHAGTVIIRGGTDRLTQFIVGRPAGTERPALAIGMGVAVEGQVVEDEPRDGTVNFVVSEGLSVDVGSFAHMDPGIPDLDFSALDGDPMVPDATTDNADGSTTFTFTPRFTATQSGSQSFGFKLDLRISPTLAAFEDEDIDLDPVPTFSLDVASPRIVLPVVEPEPGGGSPEPGVYQLGLSMGEGLSVIRGMIDWELDETATVAHENGLTFLDLNSDPPLQPANNDFLGSGTFYGSCVMKVSFKDAKDTGYEVMMFGPNGGAASGWNSDTGQFGMMLIFNMGHNLTDALPYDGDPTSSGYCYVNHTLGNVSLLVYDSGMGFFQNAGTVSNFPDATGQAVSAFVRDGGSMLAITDGAPGRLYYHDLADPFAPAVYVDDVGDAPRRVRSAGEVAAVANYGSDSLTIVTWLQTDYVAVATTVSVGDGPVGIDLMELPGGNVAIVSTGLNDDTWWLTVVAPDGDVVSNSGHALPAGITGPGHAVWLRDDNDRIMISGHTSGSVAVVESGL